MALKRGLRATFKAGNYQNPFVYTHSLTESFALPTKNSYRSLATTYELNNESKS